MANGNGKSKNGKKSLRVVKDDPERTVEICVVFKGGGSLLEQMLHSIDANDLREEMSQELDGINIRIESLKVLMK